MAEIVLSTLNARYSHASLGLRALRANLGPLRDRAVILEFTLRTPLPAIVEAILREHPRVLGLGVYVWNARESLALVRRLRAVAPDLKIVLGGPEVSHETDDQEITRLADHVIAGAGERSFARLAGQLLDGPRPLMKIWPADDPDPAGLALPYDEYDARDIAHRHLYVEASRGCPFKCAFCLSALDRTARPFEPEAFGRAIDDLLARGARRLRFVDRTFNLRSADSLAILDRFRTWLARHPGETLFLHFELIPDRLPEPLKAAIAQFPPGVLQFEIGIQTLNPDVQALIDRRQDDARAEANLRWLRTHTHAHLHVDLIAGLPGEDLASFGRGFDRLVAMRPHEIQVGLLKRLRGTPLAQRATALGLEFDPDPPYAVIRTPALAHEQVAELARFARHWDVIANSGRFATSLPRLLGEGPFERFAALSAMLGRRLGRTHGVPLEAWFDAVHDFARAHDAGTAAAVEHDYLASGASGRPAFLSRGIRGGAQATDRRERRPGRPGTVAVHTASSDTSGAP